MATKKSAATVPTKGSKYIDLLNLSKEDKDKQELEFQNEESLNQLQADILATKKAISAKSRELLSLKCAFPLESEKIIEAQVELEGLEDGLNRLNALKEELF